MPLEHLLAALEHEAGGQADTLLAEARATAAAIAGEADERLARRRGDALSAREAELRGTAEATLGETRRSARRRVLEARQRLLDRVFAAAQALFPAALTGEAYRAALPGHLAEAVACVGDEPAVIRCPESLVPAVRAALAREQHVAVEGDPAARPGVTVVTTDGVITVDNTLDGRLERLRARLGLEIVKRVGTAP